MCFVSSAATIFVLDYAQNQGTDTFMLIKTLNITAQPCSIGSFNQGYLLSLDESAFSVYSMQQELTFAAKSPVSRFLLSYNQSNAPFYIVGDKEIYKISPLTAKDKLKHLIDKKKFTGAYDLAKKFKLDRTIIDEAQIVNLIETDMMYEASQLAFNISHQSTV